MIKLISNKQLILSFLLCITCIVGDTLINSYINKTSNYAKALVDNLTHGLIGYFTAAIIVNEFKDLVSINEQKLLQIFCTLFASIIDVDHFIEAKSFSLHVRNRFYKMHYQVILIFFFFFRTQPA